jgi:hypothetical protein
LTENGKIPLFSNGWSPRSLLWTLITRFSDSHSD